jgi:integrase
MLADYKNPKLFDADGSLETRWYVFYSYKSPDDGKYKLFKVFISSRIITKTGRRDQAHRIIKEYKLKLAQGWNPFQMRERQYSNLITCLNEVVEVKLLTTRKRTSYSYRSIINAFFKYLNASKMNGMMVSNFNKLHAQEYLDYLKRDAGYSNRTYNNHLIAMKHFFSQLIKREYIVYNPFMSFQSLEVEEPEISAYTNEELAYIAKTLPLFNQRLWLIAQLVYYCFLRPQEIVRIHFGDIDISRRQIVLSGRQTKNKRTQMVDIPDPLAKQLSEMEWLAPHYYVFSKKLEPGLVEIAQTRIDNAWSDYRIAAKLEADKTIYAMKHTGAGRLVDAGIDMRSIQLQMRHYSLEQTQQYLDKFRRRPNIALRSTFPVFGDL